MQHMMQHPVTVSENVAGTVVFTILPSPYVGSITYAYRWLEILLSTSLTNSYTNKT